MHDLAIALAVLAAVLVVLAIARALAARGRSRAARRRARVAVAGEARAARMLAEAGYAIADRQVTHVWAITVDGEPHEAQVRCDYLVDRGGERWVAEVKTGEVAPRLDHVATRRQLLEYQVAYAAVGVILIDATAGTLCEVRFDLSG